MENFFAVIMSRKPLDCASVRFRAPMTNMCEYVKGTPFLMNSAALCSSSVSSFSILPILSARLVCSTSFNSFSTIHPLPSHKAQYGTCGPEGQSRRQEALAVFRARRHRLRKKLSPRHFCLCSRKQSADEGGNKNIDAKREQPGVKRHARPGKLQRLQRLKIIRPHEPRASRKTCRPIRPKALLPGTSPYKGQRLRPERSAGSTRRQATADRA